MIPMSCPSCGRRGNVPLDRLNTRMHCKKCDAVFHLDGTGKPVMGEPKAAKGAAKAARAGGDRFDDQLDPIGIVAAKLAKVPRQIYMALGGLCVAYLLYILYGFGSAAIPMDRNKELALKADAATQAFIRKDSEAMRKLATDDSKEEAARLITDYRASLPEAADDPAKMSIIVGPPSDDGDTPHTTVDIQPPMADGSTTMPPSAKLDLAWYRANNKWYLNGKGSMELNKARVDREKKAGTAKKK